MTTTETVEIDPTVARAQTMSAGLRLLANLVDQHPGLTNELRHSGLGEINVFVLSKERMAEYVRLCKAAGATITKSVSGNEKWFSAKCSFGPITLDVYAEREAVCQRVVVGTETVTETVPDPDLLAQVPTVKVTEEREIVEWRCSPLLADDAEAVTR